MSAIPEREILDRFLGSFLELILENGNRVPVELCGVHDGLALDNNHLCYAAEIRLPTGIRIEQGTYGLSTADGECWHLLFTPTRPGRDGNSRMEAVMHLKCR